MDNIDAQIEKKWDELKPQYGKALYSGGDVDFMASKLNEIIELEAFRLLMEEAKKTK